MEKLFIAKQVSISEITEDKEVIKRIVKLALPSGIKCKLYIGYCVPTDVGVSEVKSLYKIELTGTKWNLIKFYYRMLKKEKKLLRRKINEVFDAS